MAQVAQDEEIARFIQKQELKAKQRSRELEPVREYWENERATCDRQRYRLDSEGLHLMTSSQTINSLVRFL